MASRMERYYKADDSSKKRSQLNKKLYDEIYEESEYSNIEAIATMTKPNEIDITKIKEMLKNRENYKKQKQYRQIVNQKEEKKEPEFTIQAEEIKGYDIKDILDEAKTKIEDFEYRRLNNTNYNILKELKIHRDSKTKEEPEEELKDMINTITNTSLLHKLDNEQLGLDLLSDLKGNNEGVSEDKNTIRSLIEEAKKEEASQVSKTDEIDDSFYSKSIEFSKSDFTDLEGTERQRFFQTTGLKIGIALLILVTIIVGVVVFVL